MRPPVGLVVEGDCEYNTVELLIRKGIAAPHGRLPVANAYGNGALRKTLEEKLVEVVKAGHPCAIIVTLDLKDALAEGAYTDCASLRADLQARADAWLKDAEERGKLNPLPEWIRVVIQVPLFEAWLTADPEGIQADNGEPPTPLLHSCSNVDAELVSHLTWLDANLSQGFKKRIPEVVRLTRNALSPVRMATRSRSFRKFWKEVRNAYDLWQRQTGQDYFLL